MQNKKYDMNKVALVPIPWGRIIMKPIPGDLDMVCLGHCYRCEGRFYCEKLMDSLQL